MGVPEETENPIDFEVLDGEGFAEWAKEEGGRAAREDGEIVRDKDHRELYGMLEESTIETEKRILHQLDVSLVIQGLGPMEIPMALPVFREYLENKTPGRPLARPDVDQPRDTHLEKGEEAGRGLAPATIERYLVVCRRYFRFHMEVKEHRSERPTAKGMSFKGPPLNSKRRGLLLPANEFNEWIQTVTEYQDYRPRFATWLIIAGVKIDALTSLRWGSDLIESGSTTTLRADLVPYGRELPRAGQLALRSPKSAREGDLVFISSSHANPNDDAELTLSGLRRLWTSARRSHQKRTSLPGPTMRDIKTVVENVDLRFDEAKWKYVGRSSTSPVLER